MVRYSRTCAEPRPPTPTTATLTFSFAPIIGRAMALPTRKVLRSIVFSLYIITNGCWILDVGCWLAQRLVPERVANIQNPTSDIAYSFTPATAFRASRIQVSSTYFSWSRRHSPG